MCERGCARPHLPDVQNTLCNFYFYVTVIPFRNLLYVLFTLNLLADATSLRNDLFPFPFSLSPSSYLTMMSIMKRNSTRSDRSYQVFRGGRVAYVIGN